MFSVFLTRKARKQYDKLSNKDQERLDLAISELAQYPFKGKKLEGEHDGRWSYRVWPYRIIYTIDKKIITVTVVAIGHRKDVYEVR